MKVVGGTYGIHPPDTPAAEISPKVTTFRTVFAYAGSEWEREAGRYEFLSAHGPYYNAAESRERRRMVRWLAKVASKAERGALVAYARWEDDLEVYAEAADRYGVPLMLRPPVVRAADFIPARRGISYLFTLADSLGAGVVADPAGFYLWSPRKWSELVSAAIHRTVENGLVPVLRVVPFGHTASRIVHYPWSSYESSTVPIAHQIGAAVAAAESAGAKDLVVLYVSTRDGPKERERVAKVLAEIAREVAEHVRVRVSA